MTNELLFPWLTRLRDQSEGQFFPCLLQRVFRETWMGALVASTQIMPTRTAPRSCTEASWALTDGRRATIQLTGNMKAALQSSSAACQAKPQKSKVTAHVVLEVTPNARAYAEPQLLQQSSSSRGWPQVKAFIIRSQPREGLRVYRALCTGGSLAQGWHAEMPQITARPFCLAKLGPRCCAWFRRSPNVYNQYQLQ